MTDRWTFSYSSLQGLERDSQCILEETAPPAPHEGAALCSLCVAGLETHWLNVLREPSSPVHGLHGCRQTP